LSLFLILAKDKMPSPSYTSPPTYVGEEEIIGRTSLYPPPPRGRGRI